MPETRQLYAGMMSGTSLDGIDAVLVDFEQDSPRVLAKHHQPYSEKLRASVKALIDDNREPDQNVASRIGRLLATEYGAAFSTLMQKSDDATQEEVVAIGNHGQTVFHAPPVSIQLDDGAYLAKALKTPVINQFRQADLEAGGEGAPLVPAFHQHLFGSDGTTAALNIGGIANLTLLNTTATVGFDTGPGNTLLDEWAALHIGAPIDTDGTWASEGKASKPLLEAMLSDPWFEKAPPKSTGREYFNVSWLKQQLSNFDASVAAADVQATLCELTAASIANDLLRHGPGITRLVVCGGGSSNPVLMAALARGLPEVEITDSSAFGIGPDWIEACAFAWLARTHMNGIPGNIPAVTGASEPRVLGVLHKP